MTDGQDGQTEQALAQIMPPGTTLDYFIKARHGKKRNYVYDFKKAKTCDHPNLRVIARGGIVYRCLDCNYAFHIPGAYAQPLHNEAIMAAFNLLVFAKEFGMDSLGEVLRRPIGQHDGSPHKPVLPEGMSFQDVLELVEGVDVNAEDGGAAQVYKMLEEVWVGPKERQLAEQAKARQAKQIAAQNRKALDDGQEDSDNAQA